MFFKYTPITANLTFKYLAVAWEHYQVPDQHFSSLNNCRRIIKTYEDMLVVYCGGLYALLHKVEHNVHRKSSFKHGRLTVCGLHQLPWQSVHRETYLTSVLAFLPLSTFLRSTTSYSFSKEKRRVHCTNAIIFSQHTHHPSYLHDRHYWFS